MKLRSIRLENIRRFTSPFEIKDIGDGLNVLSEPNEFGKSTVFDALHALFFKPHGSADKEMKALRPHAGGAPEISVEIELPEGRFTISKRWFQKPHATVHQAGRLVAQSDAAEAWIAAALGQSGGGPAGLIWVRQGMTSLTDGTTREKAAAFEARRDLMSSVSEEVEAMTGGRRMDDALRRCQDELSTYATATGRPLKSGPWKQAQDTRDALSAERDRLEQLSRDLHEALSARSTARRILAELTDPEEAEARRRRLETAAKAHAEAERHASRVDTLERAAEMARLNEQSLRRRLGDFRKAIAEQHDSAAKVNAARASATAAGQTLDSATTARRGAADALRIASDRLAATEAERRAAQAAQAARDSADRRKDLEARISQAEARRDEMETAKAAIRGLRDAELQKIETLAAELAAAKAARNASATQITARYDGHARLHLDGAELAPGTPVPLTRSACIIIEGIGQLDIQPPETGGSDTVAVARKALEDALASHGLGGLEAARASARSRKEAETRHNEARAVLASLAPDGLEPLREALAALPAPMDHEDVPEPAAAEAAYEAARDSERAAREALGLQDEARSVALAEKTGADTLLAQLLERQARATAALSAMDGDAATLEAETAAAAITLHDAEAEARTMREAAPDLAGARAALDRAQSVEDAARKRIDTLRPELAALDERIRNASGSAVEERLVETEDALAAATDRLGRIEHEVAVLTRLYAALTAARAQARERYFEPIARELRPLLNLLWPEAELTWAEQSLLPDGLIRDGRTEPLEILSGGTQEQIALLVRLAFARMLGKTGQVAPVILDDALVFTDDDRIERMFDALHRQAGDMQILVLTCRQRAFRNLGGKDLRALPA
ncbi:GTP-binding protein [Salipiger pallidus]|uniref:GTP-binding protein n=1 Tax=Salipiger pallidus TaxID=1775170 RepID=A0A8J2ZGF0_9RHOB|nr:chromosome segregation protein SMC [Salipiger pallidus]GGG60447.1 GTP-binding protein [Salipiger pallidus]